MEIREQAADRKLVLRFSGEVDHHGAKNALRQIDRAMDSALPRSVTLDFGGVTFMDSSGIAIILRTRQRMTLLAQARRVLNAAGVGRLVNIQ